MSSERKRTWLIPERYLRAGGESVVGAVAKHDPFWGPQLVVAAAISLDISLPGKVTIGPHWLLPAVEGLLLIGLVAASPHPSSGTRRCGGRSPSP